MIYDIFTFYNELDLLEIRLEMLYAHVDYFVIVECTETFSGKQKPLYFEENKEKFKKYESKIIHYINYYPAQSWEDLQDRLNKNFEGKYILGDVKLTNNIMQNALTSPNVPLGELHWLKEFYQKECIKVPLVNLNDDDVCFIGDLDEIWNPEIIYDIDKDSIYKLKQLVYSGYLNVRSSEDWAGTLLTRYKNIKSSCLNHLRTPSRTKYTFVDNAGWHFTFMGGPDRVKNKIESYGHQEYNNDSVKESVKDRLDKGLDVLGRTHFNFWIDESQLPKYLIENKDKYKHLFK